MLLLTGCSEAAETASTVRDCAGLASDVARSGLAGTPTQTEAQAAVDRLDERIAGLGSTTVKDAATTLRDRLRELQEAAAAADPAAAKTAVTAARATTAARPAAGSVCAGACRVAATSLTRSLSSRAMPSRPASWPNTGTEAPS